jgi:hypothetical protein
MPAGSAEQSPVEPGPHHTIESNVTDIKPLSLARQAALILGIATLVLVGCSRVGLAYNGGSLVIKTYAKDYLDLDREQVQAWEPLLTNALQRHRAEELPHLAAFFEQARAASQAGFDPVNTKCLNESIIRLYRRQAQFAVDLAAPLLGSLSDAQRDRLARRFDEETVKSLAELRETTPEAERLRRARRFQKSIEEWTGPLTDEQMRIVADVTARLPSRQATLVEYRSGKRGGLIALLRAGADRKSIADFLGAWLVEFRDLPPELKEAGDAIGERMSELLIRLGATLDDGQRKRLEARLAAFRDDFKRLQVTPRVAPLTC